MTVQRVFFFGFSLYLYLANQAVASLLTFNDPVAFQAALAGADIQTIDFEGQAPGTVVPDGGWMGDVQLAFRDAGGNAFDGRITDQYSTTSGNQYLGFNDPDNQAFYSGDQLTFSFASNIDAFGLYIIASPGDVLFEDDILLSSGQQSALLNTQPLSTLPDGGEVFFLGLLDAGGLAEVVLDSICCGYFEFNIDDLQLASLPTLDLPEPAIWPLAFLIVWLTRTGSFRKFFKARALPQRAA